MVDLSKYANGRFHFQYLAHKVSVTTWGFVKTCLFGTVGAKTKSLHSEGTLNGILNSQNKLILNARNQLRIISRSNYSDELMVEPSRIVSP